MSHSVRAIVTKCNRVSLRPVSMHRDWGRTAAGNRNGCATCSCNFDKARNVVFVAHRPEPARAGGVAAEAEAAKWLILKVSTGCGQPLGDGICSLWCISRVVDTSRGWLQNFTEIWFKYCKRKRRPKNQAPVIFCYNNNNALAERPEPVSPAWEKPLARRSCAKRSEWHAVEECILRFL